MSRGRVGSNSRSDYASHLTLHVSWLVTASFIASACSAAVPVVPPDIPQVQSIVTLRAPGGQVDWSPSENLIAYDAPGLDGNYQLHVMAPDGSNDRCLTCNHPGLPKGHHGAPTWHPQGRYIVFLSEKAQHPGISYEALPGFGQYCDLWAITPNGKQVFQLTDLPNAKGNGVQCRTSRTMATTCLGRA